MIAVFKREEIKYMLSQKQYIRMRELIEGHMAMDSYGLTTIYSLYYDNANDDMIRRSIDKPSYKEKIRLRCYGTSSDEDRTVFLELKKKFSGTVYKRRVAMTLAEAVEHAKSGIVPVQSQIMSEIDYSVKHWQAYPKLMMCYDRIAMYGIQDSSLRMTFDFAIRCRRDDLTPLYGDKGHLLTTSDEVLMEIKIAEAMPMWMVKALSELRAYPVSYSKYGEYYTRELLGTDKDLGEYSVMMKRAIS
ncbi:MAG: polyphosphate polymerase domain-containing protein [Oscillospiraceae bacterium]|nr:polyphosphate polymerase domain-containing protein [Oscillospiraceae bacterium]